MSESSASRTRRRGLVRADDSALSAFRRPGRVVMIGEALTLKGQAHEKLDEYNAAQTALNEARRVLGADHEHVGLVFQATAKCSGRKASCRRIWR